jgi:DNA-binding transcriptional LysR family regulator
LLPSLKHRIFEWIDRDLEWPTGMPWTDKIKRRLKLKDLDVFMAVTALGGMGKASERLNLSQPAISKAIADLEQTLGVRLLDRSRHGVEPTVYGAALIKRSTVIFDELRQGVGDIDFIADPTAGELRLGAVEGVAHGIVAPLLHSMSQKHPNMRFSVEVAGTVRLCAELANRNIEFAIAKTSGDVPEDQSRETLFEDPLVVATAASNPLTRKRKLSLADLIDEPWVLEPADTFFGEMCARAFSGAGLSQPKAAVVTNSRNLQNALLDTGHFLSLQAAFVLRLPRRNPALRVLPVVLAHTSHPVQIITPRHRSLSPLAQLFVGHVRAMTKFLADANR